LSALVVAVAGAFDVFGEKVQRVAIAIGEELA
jgi:hypothetical protein